MNDYEGDLVKIIPDHPEEGENWVWFQPYLVKKGEGETKLNIADSLEIKGTILSDIKKDGSIHLWNPVGKVKVNSISTLQVESV